MFIIMEIIIHLIKRDQQFSTNMTITLHKTENGNVAKKAQKAWT